jgi:hypothetical protein
MKLFTLRDGQNRIVGTTTTNSNGDTVARDRSGNILGRSSQTFNNTRESSDRQASTTNATRSYCPVGKQ